MTYVYMILSSWIDAEEVYCDLTMLLGLPSVCEDEVNIHLELWIASFVLAFGHEDFGFCRVSTFFELYQLVNVATMKVSVLTIGAPSKDMDEQLRRIRILRSY